MGAPDTAFFSSGESWHQLFWTAPKGGNAYIILAHQYMAARLEHPRRRGDDAGCQHGVGWRRRSSRRTRPSSSLSKAVREQAIAYADVLDDYNNGEIGPGHCDD